MAKELLATRVFRTPHYDFQDIFRLGFDAGVQGARQQGGLGEPHCGRPQMTQWSSRD